MYSSACKCLLHCVLQSLPRKHLDHVTALIEVMTITSVHWHTHILAESKASSASMAFVTPLNRETLIGVWACRLIWCQV